jgi:signal recognition particle receptor subunit beta
MKRRQLAVRPLRRALDWFLKTRGKSTVLMCGPVDAGKTLLFHTLSGGKFQPTQTSMEENVNTFKIHEKVLGDKKDKLCNVNFEFIDFPGHPSHEFKLTKFINHLRGVIILIDASSSDSILQGSKTLFTMLEKKGFMTKKIPVLICANKIDLSESQPLTAIRQKILEEMNKLRENRGNMETIQKGDEDVAAIGQSGERLTWDTLGVPVSFGQISAKQGNVTDVLDFLEGIQHC